MLLALLARERDRQAVRAALSGVRVRFAERAADLSRPWPEGEPIAVLAELADAEHVSSVRALTAFHRRAPTVPVCAYIPLTIDAVRQVVQLAVRGIVTDVIIMPSDHLRAQLHRLLGSAHVRGETAAVRYVWHRWTPPEVRDIVDTCIATSGGAASVGDVARQLNRSARTLERQVAEAGLPPAQRILGWCRLLRAAYRLDRPKATVKEVAASLGYPSSHAFAQQLQRHTGLTITELRAGGFRGLAAHIQAELLTTHALESLRASEDAPTHAWRKPRRR